MHPRLVLLTVLSVVTSMGAQHRTTNFIVTAPTPEIAQKAGQWAEHYRREKAQLWLGYEMPTWHQPCPLRVAVSLSPPSGKTSFNYMNDQVVSMDMEIQGPLDRLIYSVLPHEITHTVFAHYFRCAVPRWADEGGSVLSEDGPERERHDQMTRNILNNRQGFRVRTLMNMAEYPSNPDGVMWLYAQGYSLSDYLVKRSNHQTFLAFVSYGMRSRSWDKACQDYLGLRSVEELEEAWLKHLRDTRKGAPSLQSAPQVQVAQNTDNGKPKTYRTTTLPPAQPLDPVPMFRGAAPAQDQVGRRFADSQPPSTPPIPIPAPNNMNWQQPSAMAPAYKTDGVQLGQLQYVQPPTPPLQQQPRYNPPAQPQCAGGNCQQPYYQQYNPAAPQGYPAPR